MLRLQAHRWVELRDGARVRLRPFDPIRAAIAKATADQPSARIEDEELRQNVAALELTDATVAAHVDGWEGIGDADGNPLPATPELVTELLRTVGGAREALNGALQEMAEAWLTEKKTWRSSQPGSAEEVPPTAPSADAPDLPAPTESPG